MRRYRPRKQKDGYYVWDTLCKRVAPGFGSKTYEEKTLCQQHCRTLNTVWGT